MAKKPDTKNKDQKKSKGRILLIAVLAVLLAAAVWVAGILGDEKIPVLEQTPAAAETTQEQQEEQPAGETTPAQTVKLDEDLTILHLGDYAGMYMEDGTNEIVSGVMMMVLENTGSQDLQLARITLEYDGFNAEFEVTNLPAGEKAVLLEKNRLEATAEEYQAIKVNNVVRFPSPMSLQEDRVQITGSNGSLTLTNISGADIQSDIYVYYKHSAQDLLYGGITYRVAVRGGLKAGESSTVIAGHYTPDTCRLLHLDCGD